MRYVIQTAISHGHIKQQITTVGSHGCIIKCYIRLFNYIYIIKIILNSEQYNSPDVQGMEKFHQGYNCIHLDYYASLWPSVVAL